MRLFAAVLPPEGAVRELGTVVDELHRLPGADGLRWTGRPGWHFTLAFYGEVEEDVVPALSERLARAAHRTPPSRSPSTAAATSAAGRCGSGCREASVRCGCWPTGRRRRRGRRASRWASTAATAPT